MHDIFWQPKAADVVRLKPTEATHWSFKTERDQPFLVQQVLPNAQQAWITPLDKKRRWHAEPISIDNLEPAR